MLSLVIPCYNQGHFLIDCLESLAMQTRLPGEVVVVNDGSTDQATNALCARLRYYDYPFPLLVLTHDNRGLPATRNRGIRHTRGDAIIPLDSDDMLLPTALEDYEQFLNNHPEVDICYPDVKFWGNHEEIYLASAYNRWRNTQHNWLPPPCAIRRRIFEAGYWYDEEMRHGFEDWEFYLRTCALGPFTAAPLKKLAFAYRRWGYTMFDLMDRTGQLTNIRRRHTALGLWSETRDMEMRTQHAPTHCWVRFSDEEPSIRLASSRGDSATQNSEQHMEAVQDLEIHGKDKLERILAYNITSRFIWLGELPGADPGCLRFLIGQLGESSRRSVLYALFTSEREHPSLLVFDRLALLDCLRANLYDDPPVVSTVLLQMRGTRFPYPIAIQEAPAWQVPNEGPATLLRSIPPDLLSPKGLEEDTRLRGEIFYFFRRPCLPTLFPHLPGSKRTLVVALSHLSGGQMQEQLLQRLTRKAFKDRFDRIYLMVLGEEEQSNHNRWERVVDGIYHLGGWQFSTEEKVKFLRQLCTASRPSHLLILDCPEALPAIPHLRDASLPLRYFAAFSAQDSTRLPPKDSFIWQVASRYTTFIERMLVPDEATRTLLTDILYLPARKVRVLSEKVDSGEKEVDSFGWLLAREMGWNRSRAA